MSKLHARSPVAVAALFLSLAVAGCDETHQNPVAPQLNVVQNSGWDTRAFDVYVQNVYLGGDTGPLFSLDFNDVPAVVAAASAFWDAVSQSAPPERIAEMVDEIARRRPQVVGLQEVLQFAVLDGSFRPIGGLDLLALMESEIAARGLRYETEVVQATTSAVLPLEIDPSVGVTRWLQFTDRLVVLRDSDLAVTATDQGVYAADFDLGPVTLTRGWARVSVEHSGTPHHFVTTHLEVQALAPVQAAQADQLLNGVVAGLEGVTIIGGDLNSDAAAEPGEVSWTPTYGLLLAGGFQDVWELAPRARRDPGYTCCQDPGLRNPVSELDQRIDFVLVRTPDGSIDTHPHGRGFFRVDLVGDGPRDLTASGLWPSDHAGIAAAVRLPPERPVRSSPHPPHGERR